MVVANATALRVLGSHKIYSLPVLINEWLPNPEGSDTKAEWVELWNNGANAVNVKGWAIATSNGKKHALPEVVIPPGGYRVVSRAEGKFVLKNENETVMLYAPSG